MSLQFPVPIFSILLSIAILDQSSCICRCGYGSYCKIFDKESDEDCYCSLSEGLYEKESNVCNKLVDHCSSNPCKNGGTCSPSFGSFLCECPLNFQGHDCSIERGSLMAKGISTYFDIHEQVLGEGITFYIIIDDFGEEFSLNIYDENNLNLSKEDLNFGILNPYNICQNNIRKIQDADPRICYFMTGHENKNIARVNLRYPVIDKSKRNSVKSIRGEIIGRSDKIQLEVFNKGRMSFNATYNIFSYFNDEDTLCSYTPSFIQCSENPLDPAKFFKMSKIVLRSVNRPTHGFYCSILVDSFHKWRIIGDTFDKTINGPQAIVLNGNDLDYGKYMVEYTIDVIASNAIGSEKKHFINFGRCWFTVNAVQVVAEAVGGSLRTVRKGRKGLTLSGALSYDTNHPDNSKLTYSWSCFAGSCLSDGHFKHDSMKYRVPDHFTTDQITMLLEVRSDNMIETTSQFFQTIKFTIGHIFTGFQIRCCYSMNITCRFWNPEEVFCLEIKNYPPGKEIRWTYKENGGLEKEVGAIRQEGTPQHQLIIPKGVLKERTTFEFLASYKNSKAIYNVTTGPFVKEGDCKISPNEGFRGFTDFTIECSGFSPGINDEESNHILSFEIYEQHDALPDILIITSPKYKTPSFKLNSGKIKVKVTNLILGGGLTKQLTVDLKDKTFSDEETLFMVEEMWNSIKDSDISIILTNLRIILTKLEDSSSKMKRFYDLIPPLLKMKLYTASDAEQTIGGTALLLRKREDAPQMELNSNKLRKLSKMLESSVFKVIQTRTDFFPLQAEKALFLLREVITCLDFILKTKDNRITDNSTSIREYASSYYDYIKLSDHALSALEISGDLLLGCMVPFQEAYTVEGKELFIFTKIGVGGLEQSETIDPSGRSFTGISFKKLTYQNHLLELQVSEFKEDPIWWKKSSLQSVNSVNVNVKINQRGIGSTTQKKSLDNPVLIYFMPTNVSRERLHGTATQPHSSLSLFDKDLYVSLHKIDRAQAGTGKIFLELKDFVGLELQVLLLVNEVPDFELVRRRGKVLSEEKPFYESDVYLKTSEDDLLYIGILPGPEQPVGATIKYSFEIHDAMCRLWNEDDWDVRVCKASHETSQRKIVCECEHLSLIGSSLLVPLVTEDRIYQIDMYRVLFFNPILFTVVLLSFALYATLLIWAYRKDKLDSHSRRVMRLEDNYPGDPFGYLLIVFTGLRLLSGTTANVGIRLIGVKNSSYAHILNHNKLNLQLGQDNWLVLHCDKYLGRIRRIHIWHDNTGKRPNWYCGRLMVYDLTADRQYLVPVKAWLRLKEAGQLDSPRLEWWLRTEGSSPVQLPAWTLVKESYLHSLREAHKWYSILVRHPRSPFTRSQRLTVLLVISFITILVAILNYDAASKRVEDHPSFEVTVKEVLVVVQIGAVAYVTSRFSAWLFRWSFPSQKETLKKAGVRDTLEEAAKTQTRTQRYINAGIALAIDINTLEPLLPVQVDEKPQSLKRSRMKKLLLINGWVVNIAIALVCASLIITYGFNFGVHKSVISLSICAVNMINSIVLYQPLFIGLASAYIGLVSKESPVKEKFVFEYESGEVYESLEEDKKHLKHLFFLRSKPMYFPLSQQNVLDAINRELREEKVRWRKFSFVIVCVIFLFLLTILFGIGSFKTPYYTENIYKMLLSDGRQSIIGIEDIIDKNSYLSYLTNVLLQSIHKSKWYNGDPLPLESEEKIMMNVRNEGEKHKNVKGWASDYMNKVLGVPRLRQLRNKDDNCTVRFNAEPPFSDDDKFLFCNGYVESWYEDTQPYGTEWDKGGNLKWNYTLPGGGYIQNLTHQKNESLLKMYSLSLSGWLDHRTKAVRMEFNLFNVHSSVIAFITVLAERLVGGVYSSEIIVESTVLAFFLRDFDIFFTTCLGIFFVVLILISIIMVIQFSPREIFNLKKHPGNFVDFILLLIGYSIIITAIIKFMIFKTYTKKFIGTVTDIFVNFSYPFQLTHVESIILCLFLLFITLRMITLTVSGHILYFIKWTLMQSFGYILAIISFIVLSNIVLSLIMIKCLGQFNSLLVLYFYPKQYSKDPRKNELVMTECAYIPVLLNYLYLTGLLMSAAVIIYFYGEAKHSAKIYGPQTQKNPLLYVFSYLLKRIRLIFPRKSALH